MSASAVPAGPGWPTPHALSVDELAEVRDAFVAATLRSLTAGFDVVEIHAAHGYLLHQFLSPLSNRRDDEYGGSLEARMRFPLEVVDAVRAAWPADKPLFVRVSSVDGSRDGLTVEDTVAFARELKARGVDAVDTSGGGIGGAWEHPIGYGYQVPFAAQVRAEAEIATMAVGLIVDARQAEAIVSHGRGRPGRDRPRGAGRPELRRPRVPGADRRLRRLPGAGRAAAGLARAAARHARPVDRPRPRAGLPARLTLRSWSVVRPSGPLQDSSSDEERSRSGRGALRCGAMAHRSALAAVSSAQLAAQLAGHVVALRRRRHFDVPFMTGSPEHLVRDWLWFGTAYSAPPYLLAPQLWATARLLPRPGRPRALGAAVAGHRADVRATSASDWSGCGSARAASTRSRRRSSSVGWGGAIAMAVLGRRAVRTAGAVGGADLGDEGVPVRGLRPARRPRRRACPGTSASPSPCR